MSDNGFAKLITVLSQCFNTGCTGDIIAKQMLNAFNSKTDINWNYLHNTNGGNILKNDIRYWHKELLVMNSAPNVDHNIDGGSFTSQSKEFFVEPRCSYTLENVIDYFYIKVNPDQNTFNRRRVAGFFKATIRDFDIDTLLFVFEAISNDENNVGNKFTFDAFRDYVPIAKEYMAEVKQNCAASGGDWYVYRSRMHHM